MPAVNNIFYSQYFVSLYHLQNLLAGVPREKFSRRILTIKLPVNGRAFHYLLTIRERSMKQRNHNVKVFAEVCEKVQ